MLDQLTAEEHDAWIHDWEGEWARDEQLPPANDWLVWLYLAGRGAGKTRTGAEWVRALVKRGVLLIHGIAPTAADARDVMVEGPSGILSVCWQHDATDVGVHLGKPDYEPSNRRVVWANGAKLTLFSAEEPDRLRGPQCYAMWADELAAWERMQETWDMAMFGLRLGTDTRAFVSTTPRPLPLIRQLVADSANAVTRGTTWDNRANLAGTFFKAIVSKYQGTRLGRQELSGEILEEAEGALWKREDIRSLPGHPDLARIVVAVDPATTSRDESALTGIIVVGKGYNGLAYVIGDYSGRYTPAEWANKVIDAYETHKADRIVAEGNQGGEMVRHTIQTAWPGKMAAPISIVHASRGKQARAEPVAALYQQGRVFHVGAYPELEDQLCVWEPLTGDASPDRLDALVWGVTELAIGGGGNVFTEPRESFAYSPPKEPDAARHKVDVGAIVRV